MTTHTLFFSPTQTGATVAKAVQGNLKTEPGESFNITKSAIEKTFSSDDIVIIAMPVYSGRLPGVAVSALNRFREAEPKQSASPCTAMPRWTMPCWS